MLVKTRVKTVPFDSFALGGQLHYTYDREVAPGAFCATPDATCSWLRHILWILQVKPIDQQLRELILLSLSHEALTHVLFVVTTVGFRVSSATQRSLAIAKKNVTATMTCGITGSL